MTAAAAAFWKSFAFPFFFLLGGLEGVWFPLYSFAALCIVPRRAGCHTQRARRGCARRPL